MKTKVIELIEKLISMKFYGKLELTFENGTIRIMKKTETIKP